MTTTSPFVRRPASALARGCVAFLVAGAVLPGVAHAGLGGAPMATPPGATVTNLGAGPVSAARIMKNASGATANASASTASGSAPYTVRQTTLASGTVVREYVSSDGTTFGVAWNGPSMPDLSELLGSYFPQYASALQANRQSGRLHGPGVVNQDQLVVRSGGHMGSFVGDAWLPQALPAGVAPSDIK
ncbi:MAG TPA: DUF2844 domain-containing protein [Paraburkholderia sp.]|jgi:hypothetical protein|nr:DUF2844 domain-containing protein [Paraburkholderia sp.]